MNVSQLQLATSETLIVIARDKICSLDTKMFLGNIRNTSCIRYMYPSLGTLGDMLTACNLAKCQSHSFLCCMIGTRILVVFLVIAGRKNQQDDRRLRHYSGENFL